MANSEYAFRTSYFKVTDEDRYKELTRGFPKSICQFDKQSEGQIWHGFGDYDTFNYYLPASECDEVTDALAAGEILRDSNGKKLALEHIDDLDVIFERYGEIFWQRDEQDDYGEGFDWFISELQKILTPDSAFVCIEAGHENLRYVDAFVIIVTAEAVCSMSLDEYIGKTLEDLLEVGVNVSWQY